MPRQTVPVAAALEGVIRIRHLLAMPGIALMFVSAASEISPHVSSFSPFHFPSNLDKLNLCRSFSPAITA
jgi:hypothetical protein